MIYLVDNMKNVSSSRPDFTPRELDVMAVLWELEDATVADYVGAAADGI